MKKIKFVELFAGIGGFRYGLEKAENYQCVWANEIDKYAAEIYRKNYGEGELYEEDITKIETKDIPEHDLLVGGFPCQTFSIAGSRAGFNDTRGTLFFEIARILKDKRPRCVLLENVKGLLSHDSGKTFQTILKVLSDIGYRTEWQVLNSSDFGVPQNRERVFIIGHLREESRLQVFPLREGSKQDSKRVGVDTAYCLDANYYKGTNNTTKKCKRQIVCTKQPTSQSKRNMPNTANSIRRRAYSEGMRLRQLTPTECERIQGFPDGWTEGVSNTQRYKQLGNAVTTTVITAIGNQLAKEVQ